MSTTSPAVPSPPAGAPKVRRQRLGIRLTPPAFRWLWQFAVAKGRKESAIIEDLIEAYRASGGGRHTESSPPSAIDRLVAAINHDRAARAAEMREVVGAVELLSEAFGRFVREWMTTVPLPADESRRAAFLQAAEAHYASFARTVAAHFARGHRFAHDLPEATKAKPEATPRAPNGGSPTGPAGSKL